MGKYKGFTCDSCGKVVDASTRTKKRTSFEGPVLDGAFTEDLCENCAQVPDGVNFKETRRRGPRPTPEDGGVAGDLGDDTPVMGNQTQEYADASS